MSTLRFVQLRSETEPSGRRLINCKPTAKPVVAIHCPYFSPRGNYSYRRISNGPSTWPLFITLTDRLAPSDRRRRASLCYRLHGQSNWGWRRGCGLRKTTSWLLQGKKAALVGLVAFTSWGTGGHNDC